MGLFCEKYGDVMHLFVPTQIHQRYLRDDGLPTGSILAVDVALCGSHSDDDHPGGGHLGDGD